eukprot:1552639-Pyramimonas_sp.AAC.1
MVSYAAWAIRDIIGMGTIFYGPPTLAMAANSPDEAKRTFYAAQMVLPFAVQGIVTTPHLLGYDFYNSPSSTWRQRLAFVKKDFGKNLALRILRQGPAFSLGTLSNHTLRTYIHSRGARGGLRGARGCDSGARRGVITANTAHCARL